MDNFLPSLIAQMAGREIGVIVKRRGRMNFFGQRNAVTTIRATPSLQRQVEARGITLDDFHEAGGEVLILKAAPTRDHGPKVWLDYTDTPATVRMRARMDKINAWLAEAPLDYDGPVLLHKRRLRRHFNNASFEQGGRLFGGFWQDLKKVEREYLYIDESPAVTLDYGQMTAHIFYALRGWPMPLADATRSGRGSAVRA
jgi:hypothetical protein